MLELKLNHVIKRGYWAKFRTINLAKAPIHSTHTYARTQHTRTHYTQKHQRNKRIWLHKSKNKNDNNNIKYGPE